MDRQFVIFTLADESFGVAIALVERIIELRSVARVPFAPDFFHGVVNLDDRVLPVLDLRKRFGFPAQPPTRETRLLVVAVAGVRVGMRVDRVTQVLTVSDADIEPLPPIVATVHSHFITGIAKVARTAPESEGMAQAEERRLIILLNLRKVLSTDEKAALQGWDYTLADVPEWAEDAAPEMLTDLKV
ncbi:MAG TPA: chemotaxis protein CheW [Anaerolineae bacterium]|nr:chemotaxis protein CheW [Anaerolineae bacterium]